MEIQSSITPANFIVRFEQAIRQAGLKWRDPHKSSNTDEKEEEFCFEWWSDNRALCVFVRGEDVELLRNSVSIINGNTTIADVGDNDVKSDEDFTKIWNWLYQDRKERASGE